MTNPNTKKLLDKYEEATHERLEAVCNSNGAKAFPKVRVADVLKIVGFGISEIEYSYALKAHFDFTVTDEDKNPLFAVEYDGQSHKDPKQIQRDKIKASICEKLDFGLLRINSNYLKRKFRGLDLLTYFVETWFLSKAFDQAQVNGSIPWDEVFDPSFLIYSSPGAKSFPYWLSLDAQIMLKKMKDTGTIPDGIPSHWTGYDKDGNCHCIAWIKVHESRYLVTTTGMRAQRFPIMQSDVLSQIAVIDLFEKAKEYFVGKSKWVPSEKLNGVLKEFTSKYRMSSFAGFSNPVIDTDWR